MKNLSRTFKRIRLTAIVLLAPMLLGACAQSAITEGGPQIALPPAPSYLRPVGMPPLDSKSAYNSIAVLRGKVDEADSRLKKGRAWYECVRDSYGGNSKTECR